MQATHETEWIPFNSYGYEAYKIQLDFSDKNFPFQRHIWRGFSGGVDEEEWIRTHSISQGTAKEIIHQ